MKKISLILIPVLILILLASRHDSKVSPDSSNLINNPSVESINKITNKPNNWSSDSWGENQTKFTYDKKKSQDGKNSLKVEIAKYTDGDAKWLSKPIPVFSDKEYNFSNYYKSSVPTDTVVRFTDDHNQITYKTLGTNPPSNSWKKINYTIKTPLNTTELTVFQIIGSVGFLQTDSYSLKYATVPIITNNIPNNSLEQASNENSNLPLAWQTNNNGANSAKFTYLKDGHNGGRSVKTQITGYTGGDAKWHYTPQPIEPEASYRFTDLYKSNIQSEVIVAFTQDDESTIYQSLKNAPASSSWNEYSDMITTPVGSQEVTVYHLIAGIGYLITDDYSLIPVSVPGFNRAIVTLTFDDGFESVYKNGLPLMKKYDISSTQYIISNMINEPNYMSKSQIARLQSNGHEIGSHTKSHADLTSLTLNDLKNELAQSKIDLERKFNSITNLAIPYGAHNDQVITQTKQYYRSARTTDTGYNSITTFNPYQLRIQEVNNSTTPQEIASWVDKAIQDKVWLIILYHRIEDKGGLFSTTPKIFEENLSYIKTSDVKTATLNQALDELTPQL
ncbi:MAG: polysaccharide deacetylase family protein [bacterium]|nr:polysaccharide deacetylase family protein [bacterium]